MLGISIDLPTREGEYRSVFTEDSCGCDNSVAVWGTGKAGALEGMTF